MKTLLATVTGSASLAAHAQMMNDGIWESGWMGGWHGGTWGSLLVVIAIVGGVAWILKQKGK